MTDRHQRTGQPEAFCCMGCKRNSPCSGRCTGKTEEVLQEEERIALEQAEREKKEMQRLEAARTREREEHDKRKKEKNASSSSADHAQTNSIWVKVYTDDNRFKTSLGEFFNERFEVEVGSDVQELEERVHSLVKEMGLNNSPQFFIKRKIVDAEILNPDKPGSFSRGNRDDYRTYWSRKQKHWTPSDDQKHIIHYEDRDEKHDGKQSEGFEIFEGAPTKRTPPSQPGAADFLSRQMRQNAGFSADVVSVPL